MWSARVWRSTPTSAPVVLECTDLPPYSARIRDELNIPVFDINTMISYVAMSLNEYKDVLKYMI